MTELIIQVENLSKRYLMGNQEVAALRDVDLSISSGEFVAIMGPSGSGKSSLMNIVGCLDRPTAGRCWLGGRELSRLSSDDLAVIRNREIGFVFQNYNLLPRMSASENVELPMVYAGVRTRERQHRSYDLLCRVGLAGREHHEPTQLSGGQQQRVAIARALTNNPILILADEPTGALDTHSGLEIMAILQDLNRQGITVVIVTHEPEVARFASRRLSFRDGRLVDDSRMIPLDAAGILSAPDREAAA